MTEISFAVGDLARFCHRSGDIDHRFSPSPTGAEGIAGHQRLYRQRPDSYQREFAVEHRQELEDCTLLLRGRADGFDPEAGVVEEIKTCRIAPDSIPEAVANLHLAQGRLYAAIIASDRDLPALEVRVTWLNIDSNEQFSRTQRYTHEELTCFLQDSLTLFKSWLSQVNTLRRARDASLDELPFPHGAFRPGQREIAERVYKCVDQRGQLLLEAPTGIGKTAAVLYPALKAMATGKHDKLLFLTSKTVGRRAAQDTLALFSEAGYRGTSLSLTAKESICLSPGKACHGEDCPYARNYYDKLPAAMRDAMARSTLTREDIEELATQHEVCPYELSRDLLPWVDVIIGDMHYMYSLGSMLGNAMESDGWQCSVVVDEAHNLPDRARTMYSAQLSKKQLMKVKKECPGAVAKTLAAINRQLLALDKFEWQEPQYHICDEQPEALVHTLLAFTHAVGDALGQEPAFLQRQPTLLDFYFDTLQFLRVAECWGEDFRCCLRRGAGRQSLVVQLNCLDPARLLSERHGRAHSTTLFSATLSPLAWSRDSLGLKPDTVVYRAQSPFTGKQLQVTLATDISTRYRDREHSMPALASRIGEWLQRVSGNCIVYFPSYAYMDSVLAAIGEQIGRRLWAQRPEMTEVARGELLELLAQRQDIAAFCILGGIFGEGIDLPGDQLRSVVVVGVGMPQVNRDTRELQAWYQARYGHGFEYVFIYPGMQKVDQALGRVVRTPDDAGHALLIDNRYAENPYRALLPSWWSYSDG